ncbi:hypothetical protein PC128_g20473 [Phytophthora cactorum]|nr:hypothetical protein PC128_g20473 [Phytophthora cactorum]
MANAMGKYERYVRAVTFLLDWLLCAHEHLRHAVNVFQLKTLNGLYLSGVEKSVLLRLKVLRKIREILRRRRRKTGVANFPWMCLHLQQQISLA